MHRTVVVSVSLVLAAGLGGCGSFLPGHVGGIATWVSPDDYAERLCANVDLEAYPSCVSNILDYFEIPRADEIPPNQATSGPFAVVMDRSIYLGHYQWAPFRSSFQVSAGSKTCRGSYDAFNGSRDALYDVYCNDGRAGWAATIHDQTGRNGIGQLHLSDGTKGEIVFGYVALGQATPYPWGDAWRPPAHPRAAAPGPAIGIWND